MSGKNKAGSNFSEDELKAMRERSKEARKGSANGEADLLAKIEQMEGNDKLMASKLHKLISTNAPTLSPKTWYGMPAYANKEGKVVCFFQAAGKFKARYATLGFSDQAKLDEGMMWPTSYALVKIDSETEKEIVELIKRAV